MKKKSALLILSLMVLFLIAGCGVSSPSSDGEKTESYENIVVDVVTNEDGYYNFMSEVEIHYYEDGVGYISLNEPTLLAFQVSSAHKGGVWLMDLDEGQQANDELEMISAELKAMGNNELASEIDSVIEMIFQSGPITKAST